MNFTTGSIILDPINDPAWTGGAVNVVPANRVGQTFVPLVSHLASVEIALKTGNPGRGGDQVTLMLLEADGRELTSAVANVPRKI